MLKREKGVGTNGEEELHGRENHCQIEGSELYCGQGKTVPEAVRQIGVTEKIEITNISNFIVYGLPELLEV